MAANMLWLVVVVACSFVSAGVVWLISYRVSLSLFPDYQAVFLH